MGLLAAVFGMLAAAFPPPAASAPEPGPKSGAGGEVGSAWLLIAGVPSVGGAFWPPV